MAQLAELGVSLPDEFRSEMAMPGEWQVTSERIIDSESTEKKPEALALGIRKREVGEEEEELNEAKKRRWGSTYRTHPTAEEDVDLDVLLNNVTRKGKEPATKVEVKEEVKPILPEVNVSEGVAQGSGPEGVDTPQPAGIKKEPSDGEAKVVDFLPSIDGVKQEGEEPSAPGVVFKKRKAKNIRQK